MSKFSMKANEIGSLVEKKNCAYGNSFLECQNILKVLYPNGISPEQYVDALAVTRVIDKLFRISNQKQAFEESPWKDIAGYAIIMSTRDDEGVQLMDREEDDLMDREEDDYDYCP